MSDFKVQDRDYDLWLLLTRTHYRIKQARTRELRQYGLSPEQAGIIYFVQNSGNNAMPIEISRWMLREPQTITSIIDRMVKKGFITRAQDPDRKNVVRISLTEKGKQAYEYSNRRESFHKIMSSLTEDKRKAFREMLNSMLDTAKKRAGPSRESQD
jgi:DNA-binding MarR family transcriptional regulator